MGTSSSTGVTVHEDQRECSIAEDSCSSSDDVGQGSSSDSPNPHTCTNKKDRKDMKYLLGNLERVPATARKLFALGKIYLTTGSPQDGEDQGFCSLFEPLSTADATSFERGSAEIADGETHAMKSNPLQTNIEGSDSVPAIYGSSPQGHSLSSIPSLPVCSPMPGGSLFTPMRKSAPLYHAQTYVQWKAAYTMTNLYSLCLPKRRIIYLQALEEFPDFISDFRLQVGHLNLDFLELLQGFAQIFFSGLEVLVRPPVTLDGSKCEVTSRRHDLTGQNQLCVNELYPYLQSILPGDGLCIAGIVWTDIYPQGYNFVLGEASAPHRSAVLSFGRFETAGFDPTTHTDIAEISGGLLWKLFKSLSHELCHLLGLEHCKFFLCAMNESRSVSEAMLQPLFLCPVCIRKLQQACGFDVLERYEMLQQFLTAVITRYADSSRMLHSVKWLDDCIKYLNS